MIASTSCAPVRTGSRLGLIVLAVLASIAGCEKTAPTETPAASSQAISPRAMLRQMADAYKGCTSYEDAGELHIVPDGGAEEEPQPFAVALERPNKARIHSLGAMVVADGSKLRACTPSLEDQVLVRELSDSLTMADFSADSMLEQSMQGQLEVELPQLRLLLEDHAIDVFTAECRVTQLTDAEYQGELCRRVSAKGPQGESVFWISPRTNLLRKFEFPMAAIRQKFPVTSLWVDFKGARTDNTINPLAFQMEIPATAKLVKRFIMPGPAAPPDFLAKLSDDFSFTDLAGGAVSRESLAGRVVVIDLWATWCGWCFEGLPLLEQVHKKFKDDDRVAILAVSKDETAVSDEKLRAAFAKHNLSIPIVRDLQQVTDQVFRVRALPTSVILGTDGTIQDYHVGYDVNLVETLPQKIEKLLNGENLAQQELDAFRQEQQDYERRLAEVLVNNGEPAEEEAAEVARKLDAQQ